MGEIIRGNALTCIFTTKTTYYPLDTWPGTREGRTASARGEAGTPTSSNATRNARNGGGMNMQSIRSRTRAAIVVPGVLVVAVLLGAAAGPRDAAAQCAHGASIFKTCQSPKRSCATNADCQDNDECTNNVCDTTISNVTDCTISLTHADTCGDTTKVLLAFDVQDFGGDAVRV